MCNASDSVRVSTSGKCQASRPSEGSFLSVKSAKNTPDALPHSKLSCAELSNNKAFLPEYHATSIVQANSTASSSYNATVCTSASFRQHDRWKTTRLKSTRVRFGWAAMESCWGRFGDKIRVRYMMVLRFYSFDILALVSSLVCTRHSPYRLFVVWYTSS